MFVAQQVSENRGEISPHFLQTLKEVFSVGSSNVHNIVIVPELIKKGNHTIYVIFPIPVQEMESFSLYLEGQFSVQVIPEYLNPYVIKFKVPEKLIESSGLIDVIIQLSDTTAVKKSLRVISQNSISSIKVPSGMPRKPMISREECAVDDQLQFLPDAMSAPIESLEDRTFVQKETVRSSEEQEIFQSLMALCKKYRLEELSFFVHGPETSNEDFNFGNSGVTDVEHSKSAPLLKQDSRGQLIGTNSSFLESEKFLHLDDGTAPVKRCLSLPSVFVPLSEERNIYKEYLNMQNERKDDSFLPTTDNIKDHLDEEYGSCSGTDNGYVYMKWDQDNVESKSILKKELSKSQLELLDIILSFKYSESTISEAEDQFQSWEHRHNRQSRPFGHDEYQRLQTAAWESLMRRKLKRKGFQIGRVHSRVDDPEFRHSASESTDPPNSRKESNTSITSSCSESTENSSSTVYFGIFVRSKSESVSTSWIPTYSTSSDCPFYSELTPPPLPPRPPGLKKPQEEIRKVPTLKIPQKKTSNELLRTLSLSLNDLDNLNDSMEMQAESPDYVTPNNVYHCLGKQLLFQAQNGQNNVTQPICSPQAVEDQDYSSKVDEASLPMNNSVLKEQQSSPVLNDVKTSIAKNPFFIKNNQLIKPQKTKESKFHASSRRWSSFPDLRTSENFQSNEPIYIEVMGSLDNESKSINESDPNKGEKCQNIILDKMLSGFSCETDEKIALDKIQPWSQYSSKVSPVQKSTDYPKSPTLNEKVSIFIGDITKLEVDAIVNVGDIFLRGGGGLLNAYVHRAAGPNLKFKCITLGGCSVGKAKITPGYRLPAKCVIHTAGPFGEKRKLLKNCYFNSLTIAKENRLRSIAFPCISTGCNRYPHEKAAHVALETVRSFLTKNESAFDRVIFCLFLPVDVTIYEALMQEYFPV